MAKRTTTKDYLLKLLNDLSNHNIHTSDDQDWPDELRDRVHNLIDCLEKSSDGIPADLKNANCAIFDVSQQRELLIAYECKMYIYGDKQETLKQATIKVDKFLSNL